LPAPSTISLASSLVLNESGNIFGPGPAALTIRGNGTFSVLVIGGTYNISGLTITGGGGQVGGGIDNSAGFTSLSNCVITGNTAATTGGGIYNSRALTMSHCTISGNSAMDGAGIENQGPFPGASLIINSTITHNSAMGSGGGIDYTATFTSGPGVDITNCTISGNSATQGGGINIATALSTIRITGSTVSSNSASDSGGGIYTSGTTTIQGSTISGNVVQAGFASDGLGGGIISLGSLAMRECTVAGNSAIGGDDGGGGGGNAQGGGIDCAGVALFVNCAITGNHTTGGSGVPISGSNGGAGFGGGIYAYGASLTLTNCTVGGNTVHGGDASQGQGGSGYGGGIYFASTTLSSASDCTFAKNQATAGAGGGSPVSQGGGVFLSALGSIVPPLILTNSIVAANTAQMDPDIYANLSGGLTTSQFNLIGDGTGSTLTNGSHGNQVGTTASPIDPGLNALANYGGPTQTMALKPTSPAIDAGSNAVVTATSDQRGFARIFDGTVDIGAYEFQSNQPIHLVAVGAGYGMAPEVKVYDPATGQLRLDFLAYESTFKGGVRVAVADMNGDGIPDIVTAPGGVKVTLVNVNGGLVPSFDMSAGRAPEIKVFSGIDGTSLDDFLAYPSTFKAGVFLAVADVNDDGKPDIITAPDATGQSGHTNVRVFFNGSRALAADREFNAYDPGFGGGVRLAAADLNHDGFADIVTGPGIWSGPDIRVFDGKTLPQSGTASKIGESLAYNPRYFGGVFVATGDVNGDGLPDIVTGTNGFGGPEVKAFSGINVLSPTPTIVDDFFAYDPGFSGGARVAVMDVNGDGKADIITGAGPGGGPHVRIFDGGTGQQLQLNTTDSFMAFDPSFSGGVFIGGT
jgi:predicted outer membrane repeat protein